MMRLSIKIALGYPCLAIKKRNGDGTKLQTFAVLITETRTDFIQQHTRPSSSGLAELIPGL
jgi:hypothetical protein